MIYVGTKNGEALINDQNVALVEYDNEKNFVAVVLNRLSSGGIHRYRIDDVTVFLPPNTPFRELEETKRMLRRGSIDRKFYRSATVRLGYFIDDIKYDLNDDNITSIDVLREKLKAHIERLEKDSQQYTESYEKELQELQKE